MHLIEPAQNGDWRAMLVSVKKKREQLERKAVKLELNEGTYIRPIALIQVERTGKEQRGQGFVHSEDVREFLIDLGIPRHEVAVRSSSLDEIKQQKLLSKRASSLYHHKRSIEGRLGLFLCLHSWHRTKRPQQLHP